MLRIVSLWIGLGLALLSVSEAKAADEPPHRVILRDGPIEIRDYDARILAEVDVSGQMGAASNAGFRPLAGYIFGGNQTASGGSTEIAMTTPVTQTPVIDGETTEMDRWRVAFVMPPQWSMDTLPRPRDPRVSLREVPAERIVAIRFNGGSRLDRFRDHEAELRRFMADRGLQAAGEAVYARYDPPWIPTPFRRNEVMIPVFGVDTSQ